MEFVKDAPTRQQLELIMVAQNLDRPVLAPPGVPAERVEALRAAFRATMSDPAFRAEIAKRNLQIAPTDGEAMTRIYAAAFAYPAEIVAAVREMMAGVR
jgi:tripartite-type tricarboxylate transporter receptor subunit TctC